MPGSLLEPRLLMQCWAGPRRHSRLLSGRRTRSEIHGVRPPAWRPPLFSGRSREGHRRLHQCHPSGSSVLLRHAWRGKAYWETRRLPQAVSDLTDAIRIDPKDAMAYSCRSMSHSAVGDNDLAIADANEAPPCAECGLRPFVAGGGLFREERIHTRDPRRRPSHGNRR